MRTQIMQMMRRMIVGMVMAMAVIEIVLPMRATAAPTEEAQRVAIEKAVAAQISLAVTGTPDVQTQMEALQEFYPEGTPWTNAITYYNYDAWDVYAGGCAAFAMLASDATYGTTASVAILTEQTPTDILPGDVVRINGTHSVFVISTTADAITVCEGNYNASVHWGRVITRQSLDGQITYIKRRCLDDLASISADLVP